MVNITTIKVDNVVCRMCNSDLWQHISTYATVFDINGVSIRDVKIDDHIRCDACKRKALVGQVQNLRRYLQKHKGTKENASR